MEIPAWRFTTWCVALSRLYMPICGLDDEKGWPDSCSVNLYEDGRSFVRWHAGDEDIFNGKIGAVRIISVSLGQTTAFELRPWRKRMYGSAPTGSRKTSVDLCNGDVVTMEGHTQQYYQHRAPPVLGSSGPRINVTWRWLRHSAADGRIVQVQVCLHTFVYVCI